MNRSIHTSEREFHDEWAETIDPATVPVVESFESSTCPESRWIVNRLGDLEGRRVLELGSGAGEGAVYFALRGADVVATDISPKMLEVVQSVAEHHGVAVDTEVALADDLSMFADDSFDVVYAANLLHHVDIESCLKEVQRVLKPGGRCAFWDPVAYNPVINLYRRMASKVRTEDEHPLRKQDLRTIAEHFNDMQTRFFWFSSLLLFVKFYLIDRIHPNSDRYWKRIITHEAQLRWMYRPLAALDSILLTVLPFARWWCWNVAVVGKKPAASSSGVHRDLPQKAA